jgi:hypothetical protein
MSILIRASSVRTPADFSDFCSYINDLYMNNKEYIFNDNVIKAMNELNEIICKTTSYRQSAKSIDLPIKTVPCIDLNTISCIDLKTENIDNIQKYCILLFEQAKSDLMTSNPVASDPVTSDHIIELIVKLLTNISQIIFNSDESAFNIDEIRTYVKSYIYTDKVCSKYHKFNVNNIDFDTKNICLFIKAFMFMCTECGLCEDSHVVCNKYDDEDNNYYCKNCGMSASKHKICDSFKYDNNVRTIKSNEKITNSIYEIHIFDEDKRHCTDCGIIRRNHIQNLRDNQIYPCELYSDDTHGYCKTCTYGIVDHMLNNVIHGLTDKNYNEANIKLSIINVFTDSFKTEINLAICRAVYNITQNTNGNIIREYFNMYFTR